MTSISKSLYVSYSQLAIFDSSLSQPFSFWTERHFKQGFAWRPRSVSFNTVEQAGQYAIDVVVQSSYIEPLVDAIRIIEVPFEVYISETVEVASISEGFSLNIEPDKYALRFEYCFSLKPSFRKIRLVFQKNSDASFKVIRADAGLSITDSLLLDAEPA